MRPTNRAFIRIAKRAESQEDAVLRKTFVDTGSVFTVVGTIDHQIIAGRRGTGKTHLLTVLRQDKEAAGEVAIQVDMRNLGSSGGIYADPSVPLSQRATKLSLELLTAMHELILSAATAPKSTVDMGATGPALNELFDTLKTVHVEGNTVVETATTAETAALAESKLGITVSRTPSLSFEAKGQDSEKATITAKKVVTGKEIPRVDFGAVSSALRKLVGTLPGKRLWLLIDEWSEVPLDLQPHLADMVRRSILPVKGAVVKIAAVEQRSQFRHLEDRTSVGIELGSDVATSINLDDHMVFDKDEARAIAFFKSLVLKHVQAAMEADGVIPVRDAAELMSAGFTQSNAFAEVVRACEGVPRDAINILSQAAQRCVDTTIGVPDVREAAQKWYQSSKDSAVSVNVQAKALLVWIIERVIKGRSAKAFLLESGTKDPLIDFLYDERVLHVLKRSMSAQDEPGQRYTVYGIDYGCYVDLLTGPRGPKYLLFSGETTVTVPLTDLRSVRRCILDLYEFYLAQAQEQRQAAPSPAAARAANDVATQGAPSSEGLAP